MNWLANPFNLPLAGVVDAAGDLTIRFGPPNNQAWEVSQVSLEMPNAPQGTTVELRYMNSFISAPRSARKATAGTDPPIYLQPGETMTVVWANSTPNLPGAILVVYRKGIY